MIAKIKNKKNHNLKILLEKLKEITKIGNDNKISFYAFEIEILEWMFLSIIDFGYSLSIESRKSILTKTFRKIALDDNYDSEYFLNQLNTQIRLNNNKEEKTYFLLTSLSVKNLPFRKVNIGNCKIKIHGKQFPEKFRTSRNAIFKSYSLNNKNEYHTKLSIEIKSKNFKDAYEQSFQFLEVFRSLLCLFLNSSFEISFGSRSQKPINKISHGEIFTLHNADGTNANDKYYWCILDFKKVSILSINEEKRKTLKSDIRWSISSLNKCKKKHQNTISKALKLYVNAFDEYNKHTCFLESWTVLETLLNTDQNDLLIKRAISMYHLDAKAFEKQQMECLRQYRNEYVHKGGDGLNPLIACYQLQTIIFNIIIKFNLEYYGFFNNIEEANLFLDNYNPSLKELETRKKVLDKAIKLKEKNTKR